MLCFGGALCTEGLAKSYSLTVLYGGAEGCQRARSDVSIDT